MKKLPLTLLIVLSVWLSANAQVTFQKSYGAIFNDEGRVAQQTNDGGFIFVGTTQSYGSGGRDIYLIKTDGNGVVQWSQTYGKGGDEWGYAVQQTTDSGYVVGGTISGSGAGGRDMYLMKTDASGNLQWSKSFGGNNNEEAYSVQQTTDGGYVLGGYTRSFGGGGRDVYVVKTTSTGTLSWSRTIDNNGGSNDYGRDIHQTADGGYICVGYTDGGSGNWDVYLIKLTSAGAFSWAKDYGAGGNDQGYAVQELSSGGYILTGTADDFGPGNGDVILMKTDATGNMVWSKAFGGPSFESGYAVQQLGNGNFIIAGETGFGSGGQDFYALETDANGNLITSKTFGGGGGDEIAYAMRQTTDGGFMVSGGTQSFSQGNDWNFYLVKTDASLNTTCNTTTPPTATISWSPSPTGTPTNTNPATNVTTITPTVVSAAPILMCVCSPVADFASTAPQCTGLPVDFTNLGSSATGLIYSWAFGTSSSPTTSTVQNPTGIVYSTSGIKLVTFKVSDGACSDSIVKPILIHQTPTVSLTSTAPQCDGVGVNFTNTGSTGSKWSYAWTFGQDAMPASSTAENPMGIIYQNGGAKVVTFTISDQNCINTYTTSININNAPVVDAGKDTIICNNASVQIGSVAVAGNTYSWFPSSTLSNTTIANPVSSPIAPTTNYIVTVRNANGCTATDSAVVTMLAPLAANAGVDVAICRYDSIQIGAALVTGENYSWSSSLGLNSTASPSPMASPDVTTTYTLLVSGPGCGPVKDEVTVTVHQLPLAKAVSPNDTITVGSSTQLIATGGVQYTWSSFYALDNIAIFNPIANPTITTTYTVTVVDVFGCKNIDTTTVYVIDASFWLPSAFTPDGNGENDVLFVRGSGINNFEFAIFNRWGEQVFYATDTKQGWNGMKQGTGEQLPQGAYAYFIKGVMTSGTAVDAKGLVNLIR
ncbi:MAG: gliding motility-associated C-terminal domain-containing protein [Bacteroidetes bacterium]|nr:gliding motility-associated C-terminal domain-containing protein [Bacteroidota bacterium]